MNSKVYYFLLALILGIGLILRFYNLSVVPNGLQQDETSLGYNAYSILTTGKDEYGKPYPLYFQAFGEYKLPVYVYVTVPSIAVFGLNEFGVRFPSALFGFLTIPVFYLLVRRLFEKQKLLHIIATALFALNPWQIHFSRGAFEVTPALFFITLGILFYVFYIQKKKFIYLLLGVIFLGVSIYTYNIARLFIPMLFVYILCVLYKDSFRNSKKQLIGYLVTCGIVLFPLSVSVFSEGGLQSTQGTLLFSSAVVQAPLVEFRSYLIELPQLYSKIFFNSVFLTLFQFIKNIFSYFSVNFFFLTGSLHGNHGIGNVGMFYIFESITILLGVYKLFITKSKWNSLLIFWTVGIIAVASLTRETPHATRSFFIIPPFIIFSALGLYTLIMYIHTFKNKIIRSMVYAVGGLCIFYSVIYYLTMYYVQFPLLYAKQWRSEDKALVQYINSQKSNFSKIIIDKNAGFIYSSYLFHSKFSPEHFQNVSTRFERDNEGFTPLQSIDTIEYKDINWEEDLKTPNTLIITSVNEKPENVSIVKEFYYPKRPVAVALNQEILQFPVEDVAYVVIKTE